MNALNWGNAVGSIGQGIGQGLVRGTILRREWDIQDQDARLQKEKMDQEARLKQNELDMKAQEAQDKKQSEQIRRKADAMRIGFDAAKNSKDPKKAFRDAYKAVIPDEEPPDIDFKTDEDTTTIRFPDGTEIKGSKQAIQQATEIITKNPGKAGEVIGKLNELGLAEIKFPEPKEPKEADGRWETQKGPNGRLVQKNTKTGEVRDYPGQASASESRAQVKDKDEAMQRISTIEVTLTKLKSGGVSQDMLDKFPSMAPYASMLGQKLSKEDYQAVEKVLRFEQEELRKTYKIGKGSTTTPASNQGEKKGTLPGTGKQPTTTAGARPSGAPKDTDIVKGLQGKPAMKYNIKDPKTKKVIGVVNWDGKNIAWVQ